MRTPLQKNEKVLLITRMSWVVLIVPASAVLLAIFIATLTVSYSNWFLIIPIVALLYFIWKYYERQHNLWAITNFRVIDEFGVVNINTKESPLDKINNVSYSQNIWGRLIGYGDVEIQTAATVGATVYHYVEKPNLLKDTITSAQANYRHEQFASSMKEYQNQPTAHAPIQNSSVNTTMGQSSSTSSQLATELEKLFDLRQRGVLTETEFQLAKTKLLG
jgi:uncharacterized membrane protein YdbT with pleckstrin-like domain